MAAPDLTTALRAGLNLMRRLPPRDVHQNLSGLTAMRPELTEEFLQRVDQPLQTRVCSETKRRYLLCDYNRDGDAYRSPWSNAYDPPLEDGFAPSAALRELEVAANEVFDAYREAYYEAHSNSVSSVYMWELGGGGSDVGFASCWLIKKEISGGKYVTKGEWDSIHVIEVSPAPAGEGGPSAAAATAGGSAALNAPGRYRYKLTSTVLLSLLVERPDTVGSLDLSGSLTKQATAVHDVSAHKGHVANCGVMIEAMEGDMRGSLDALYISKTREIVSALHARSDSAAAAAGGAGGGRGFVSDLAAAVKRHGTGASIGSGAGLGLPGAS